MKPQEHTPTKTRPERLGRGLLAAVALICPLLLAAAPASAAPFEQVACFAGGPSPTEACKPVSEAEKKKREEEGKGEFTEEVQLGGIGGMAVNYTGAGGVAKGTVYAAVKTGSTPIGVVMFTPQAGGLKFAEAWRVTPEENEPYERCGPLLGTELKGSEEVAKFPCPTRVGEVARPIDVEVNQASGDVFVYDGLEEPGRKAIVAYKADGSEELTRFGEIAPASEKISESPAKIHRSGIPGMLAVGTGGEVFVYDQEPGSVHHRLMRFKPNGGGGYEYAAGEDVGTGSVHQPTMPVADAAGSLYVASESTFIEAYDPSNPADPPTCTYKHKQGGITAVTVNPLSRDVFFYSFRIAAGFTEKTVHQLGPCNEATGKFEGPSGEGEVAQFEVAPERDAPSALAFDPTREFSPDRGEGALYGGAPGPAPPLTLGEGEPGQSSLGYVFAPKESKETPPLVQSESVSHVTAASAGLHATIDPNGVATNYAFQYLTEDEYEANEPAERFAGAKEAPPGGAPLQGGPSKGAKTATVTLAGLAPDTAYRYRVIATNHCAPEEPERDCPVLGEAQRFRTYPTQAAGLPDRRAYELVSPTEKSGGQVLPAEPRIASCGSEVECKPGSFTSRFPMQSAPGGDAVAYEGTAFGPGAAALVNSYIARRDPVLGWQSVNPTPTVLDGKSGAGYMAFSPGLGEGLLRQTAGRAALSPQAPPGYDNLYAQPTTAPFPFTALLDEGLFEERPPTRTAGEFRLSYAGASADLSRVFFEANDALTGEVPGIAPEAIDGGASKYNLYEWERATGQLRLVNVFPGNASSEPGASFAPGGAHSISADGSRAFFSDEAGALYVREDATLSKEIPGSGPSAKFLAAAGDGSRVLLTDGSLYDLQEETTTDLTQGQGGFLGIAGQSEDLSHLYFVDTAVLAGAAQAGKNNLYARSEGATGFIATLAATDNSGGSRNLTHSWDPIPSRRTAEASPQGRYLAFLSQAPLTGFESTGPCETDHFGGFVPAPCPEVFLYDSQAEELLCPSCNPSGAAALGWSVLPKLLGIDEWTPQPRYLTDSGRLYFDSQDSLSPSDTNEGVEDVYQYEPGEVGTCKREAGCLTLISAGREAVDSNFLAADSSGKNVFFTSRDQLVLKDKDQLIDLYDAREGGGIASETELPPSQCQGEACQPPAIAPEGQTPASSSFRGAGNLGARSAACAKGKVRRRGRCVRKHVKRSQRKERRANHDRGGTK